ncbi:MULTISPECIES: phage tail assembly chaperone [Paenibacillus]|uniref:Phage portal protein n=1 Tax=Paenibacillus campinasensis TaxID=66347 RepID=A0A268EY09_9BACL|nr:MULTISPECIES: phage portal protein [Paenibacillus]MUG66546.1 phage portal protein [Paenibacillus campinasensis]PAD78012.1 phage portal protein [Paenibacillus campinasensis]PAK52907.1 phage portal protein [Paenibacillus sp. 7541]
MSDFSMFFAEHSTAEITEEFVVSVRFKDAEGHPVPWKLRSITEEENQECRKAATRKIKGKNGVFTPEIDANEYMSKLMVASVIYPDLKNSELQKSYGVLGAEALLRKMLLPGEFAALGERVQALNGFDRDINELVDEVKN